MLKSIRLLFFPLLISTIAISLNFPSPPPPTPIGPYLNGIFPESTPGAGGSWELEDPLPDLPLQSPLRILPFPGSIDIIVLTKMGEVWRISLEAQTKTLLLDIKDRAFKRGEAGPVGIALHPRFGDPSAPDKQLLFMFYRTKPDPIEAWSELGFNRLSKFTWDMVSETFDPASEEILIQQYDRSTWHNGGGMFFGPDDFLYLSLGDEGDASHQSASTQRLDGGLFSGVLRIDVDNDPARSHPIRRQPLPNANPPAGWGDTYTQGYSIPNDNPWLNPDGSILEEFYAIGVRSPYSMSFDPESQQIWLADVGASKIEEISHVEKGDNLQWPYKEGTLDSEEHTKPEELIGKEKEIYFEYDRTIGSCIIGGRVYRGNKFPQLNGKYLFADFVQKKLMALTNTGINSEPVIEILLSNLGGQPVELPESPGITGIFPLEDGQILITVMGEIESSPGKIFRLRQRGEVPEPPSKLSELGAFTDLNSLNPAPGIIPYRVNAPLWSDRALKKRWIAIPNDGAFDSPEEKVFFQSTNEWTFPEGTVFIKQFDLPLTEDPNGEIVRLETRFFIIGENDQAYGLTYKWNAEGTEAFLLGGGASSEFDINEGGSFYTQTWNFPSRDQCMSCHNANANYVLGVNTHQLNGDQYYDDLGYDMNQLAYLNQLGLFQRDIGNNDSYPRSYFIEDESADLELRIRSYLDANCASCHRPGGLPMIQMDLRYSTPLRLQNIIHQPTQSQSSDINHLIVKSGAYETSELWVRDASVDENRMPPLGRNLVDPIYIDQLVEWIGNLPEDAGKFYELLLFPNPSNGEVSLRINDDWSPPFQLRLQTISGQLIYQETSESRSIQLNLTNQPAGTYILEITAGGERQIKKIVLK